MRSTLSGTAARRALIDAFLAGDAAAAAALLAPEAAFHSPVRDYHGADRIARVWDLVKGVLAGAVTTRVHEDQGETVAFFAGRIEGRPVDGVLRVLGGADGRVADVTLMVRPLGALKAGLAKLPR
jgi:ketosteroid isomerase-like protein